MTSLDSVLSNLHLFTNIITQQLMKLALEQEKRSKLEEKERVKEDAADAVADQIRADVEAEEEAKLKKKKKGGGGKKKGKK